MDCNTQIYCPVHIHYVITTGMCQALYFDSSQLIREPTVFSEFSSINFRGNVMIKARVKFTLENVMKAKRYCSAFFNLGARWVWVVHGKSRPLYPRERNPAPIYRWLGESPKTDLEVWGKSRSHWHSCTEGPDAIPNEQSRRVM
jgi:hypothetical protein